MCGRYTFYKPETVLQVLPPPPAPIVPKYNVAPSQQMPIVMGNGPSISIAKWGIIPHFATEFKPMGTTFNARIESLEEKAVFKGLFAKQRCLVPLNGYYEWQGKTPLHITLKQAEAYFLAGIYSVWNGLSLTNQETTYSVLTLEAHKTMADIHSRMPVVFTLAEGLDWLSLTDEKEALARLLPKGRSIFNIEPANLLVNSVKNEGPQLLVNQQLGLGF